MRVFVTGSTGFVGSAVVQELLKAGHSVLGLVRSDANAKALAEAGGEVHRGDLEDLDALKRGAAACDGVIHTAFIHDFSKFAENGQIDKRAIAAMGEAIAGSNKPLVVSSGILLIAPGELVTEETPARSGDWVPRVSESAANALVADGVRASSIRLAPTVHGRGDHGFVPTLIEIARAKGVSAYVGDGESRWTAVHRLDAASLYRLALEKGAAGAAYHGVAEEGIRTKDIAEVIGRKLNLPVVSKSAEEAGEHFGFLGMFIGTDAPASNKLTRERLGWIPTHPGLIADLEEGMYFEE